MDKVLSSCERMKNFLKLLWPLFRWPNKKVYKYHYLIVSSNKQDTNRICKNYIKIRKYLHIIAHPCEKDYSVIQKVEFDLYILPKIAHGKLEKWAVYREFKQVKETCMYEFDAFNIKHQKYMSIIFYMNMDMDEKIHIVLLILVSQRQGMGWRNSISYSFHIFKLLHWL